jgi:hypothetical protein
MEEKPEIKEYADGWITEKEGTDIPAFLKGVYVVWGLACASYLILYMNGEVDHSDRGTFVRAMNAATTTADGFMMAIAAMAFLYVFCVLFFAFRSGKH